MIKMEKAFDAESDKLRASDQIYRSVYTIPKVRTEIVFRHTYSHIFDIVSRGTLR